MPKKSHAGVKQVLRQKANDPVRVKRPRERWLAVVPPNKPAHDIARDQVKANNTHHARIQAPQQKLGMTGSDGKSKQKTQGAEHEQLLDKVHAKLARATSQDAILDDR